jgi:hypothetical protein
MSIYEDIINDFFAELKKDNKFPAEIREDLELLLKNDMIKSDDIIAIIKRRL